MSRAPTGLLLLLLAGCGGTAESVPSQCDVVLQVSGAAVGVDAGRCAQATLEGSVMGEGVELSFTQPDPETLVPVLTAGASGGVVRAVTLRGAWAVAGDAPARWWRQGYQSWSWSGVTELTPIELAPLERDGGELPRVGGDEDSISVVEETPYTSWWGALLGRSGGASLLVGALSATRTRVWMAADDAALWVVWGGRGEELHLDPGATLSLDAVWLTAGDDPNQAWEDWADEVATTTPPRGLDAPVPSGWSDWYSFYGRATEDDILGNLEVARAQGLELVQVDDGWERAWGDWSANDAFPSGTAGLAAEIAAAGLTPGLWMAPFYVDRSTATFLDHPDWWVLGPDGAPLDSASCDCAVLDVTHPDAAAWMAEQVRARVAEGWTYLKLDFLYAGALEGTRREPITGMEAYARGVALLREAAGDAWILACGAPLLPSVGFAESYRSGADIAFVQLPDPDPAFLRWQARSTAARAFANGRWWWSDADNVILRAPFGEVERRGALAAQAASGGTWLLGDDLRALDPDVLAQSTAPALLALRGQTVRPLDPLAFPGGVDGSPLFERGTPDDRVPTTWGLADGTTVLLNLSEVEVTVDGPGGTELLTGVTGQPGPRVLAPGDGELWR